MIGFVTGGPRLILRLEGLGVLVGAITAYASFDANWWVFVGLFFAPDVAILPYLINSRAGGIAYNVAHTYLGPIGLAFCAHLGHAPAMLPFAAIWAAHIGFDRTLGFGLKYETGFKDTHLGHPGRW